MAHYEQLLALGVILTNMAGISRIGGPIICTATKASTSNGKLLSGDSAPDNIPSKCS